jgi:hypothetical protein
MIMQKIFTYVMTCILAMVTFVWFLWICEWQRVQLWWTELDRNMTYLGNMGSKDKDSTELWDHVSIKENENTILVKLLGVFWLDDSIERWRDLKFIDYARAIINMALWLVAFIALIMSLYTFYMMFFTEDEAWIKKAKWNLVGIFIALGILWLAWIIVSFIFWWYQSNWKAEEQNLFPGLKAFNYMDSTLDEPIYFTI